MIEDLPMRRKAVTHKVYYNGTKLIITIGFYDDGRVGEIFINGHREGEEFRTLMNGIAMLVSSAIQHGMPVEEITEQFDKLKYSKYLKIVSWVLKHPHYEVSDPAQKEIVLIDEDMV